MDISDINEEQYIDIFNLTDSKNPTQTASFGSGKDDSQGDIFKDPAPITDPVVVADPAADTPKLDDKEVDILGDGKETQPKYDFKDTSGYFADRFKSGKFVGITEDHEDGSKTPFIPKTPEDFDEVIDIQVNYQLEQRAKELEEKWYSGKSQAWQAVGKYAEMTDNPADLLPFLAGMKTIQTVSELDPSDLAQAEKLVRIRLEKRGEDDDSIADQIDSLKTTDKLISTAQRYKPSMVNEEKAELANQINQKRAEEQEYIKLVNNIKEQAYKSIVAPIFGKQVLKKEEQAAIYDLIGEPSRETKGYQIYNAIDEMFEKGDFETLKQIGLLITNKESFYNHIAVSASNKTAESLQKKLRVAADSMSSGKDGGEAERVVSRGQYNSTAKFGR